MLQFKPVDPSTVQALHQMILESAEECGARTEVTTTPEHLTQDAFGNHPCFEAIIAWEEDMPVGFALWFSMYSAWKGKRTLYLEDLYVRPFWRKRKLGSALFAELERIAISIHANLAWECNRDRIDLRRFFTNMGAIDRSSKVSFYMEEPDMKQHLKDLAPRA